MSDTPTAPTRGHRTADQVPLRRERDGRRTLSTTTRTCNTVADVYMYTSKANTALDGQPP